MGREGRIATRIVTTDTVTRIVTRIVITDSVTNKL